MPKVSSPIKDFNKGLNDKDSPKDLGDGFLAEALNIDLHSVGKISALCSFVTAQISSTNITVAAITDFEPG